MANYYFRLRDASSTNSTPIVLFAQINGNRIKCKTNESTFPENWDHEKKLPKDEKKNNKLTLRLNYLLSAANDTYLYFRDTKKNLNPDALDFQNKFYEYAGFSVSNSVKEIEKETLLSFIKKVISQSKTRKNTRTGKTISTNTIKVYNQCLRLLTEFNKTKRRIDFQNIDLDFYHDFKEFMINKEYSQNTIAKHIITLKSFLNEATERGLNTTFAYKSRRFTAPQVETDTIYLDSNELNELFKLDLTKDSRLERVRDLFLVGCYTGLRFSDFSNISPNNIKGNLIEIRAQKTNDIVVIPIHPHLRHIMSKYVGKTANSLPPSISNQKLNKYLKELGEKIEVLNCKIVISTTKGNLEVSRTFKKFEKISTHTARRSFATNLYNEKFPTQGIMKLTGHRTEKSFLKYIRVTPNENAIALSEHWENNSNLKIG